MSPTPASIRFFLHAGESQCNGFSCYLIKLLLLLLLMAGYVPGVVQIGPVCTGLLCMPEDLTGSLDIA